MCIYINNIKIIKQTSGPQFRPAFQAINAIAQYRWDPRRSGICPVHCIGYGGNQTSLERLARGLFTAINAVAQYSWHVIRYIFVIYGLFNDTGKILTLKRTRKEAGLACFKATSWNSTGWTEEKHEMSVFRVDIRNSRNHQRHSQHAWT